MFAPMRPVALASAVFALLLSACDTGPTFSTPASPSPFFKSGSLIWYGCGGSFECTSVAVPLDYSNPARGAINIAVSRVRATSTSERIGSLLINPGGPGTSGVDFLRNLGARELSLLGRRFDLVSFDPRGVGRSSPVQCLSNAQRDASALVDPVLDDPQEKQEFLANTQAFVRGCQEKSGRLLPFVDTASAARDLDAIRVALGEKQLTYLGFSYGTFLGEVYAHLYPTHIRAMALDGVVDSTVPGPDWLVGRAKGLEANLQAFFAYCLLRTSCLLGSTGDPSGRLTAFLRRLDSSPLPVRGRKMSRGMALVAISSNVIFPSAWDGLSSALNAADEGDGSALMLIYDTVVGRRANGSYSGAGDATVAINCIDDRPIYTDSASYENLGEQLTRASTIFGPALQYSLFACSTWPVNTKHLDDLAVVGAPSILLIGATGDPLTPAGYALSVSKRVAGSVVLIRAGVGHLSYDKSLCVQVAVDAYLTDLTIPAPGTICPTDAF